MLDVLECLNCKARYVYPFQANYEVYEQLHRGLGKGAYRDGITLSKKLERFFESDNKLSYRKLLCQKDKFKHIVETLEQYSKDPSNNILEVGCARGQVTGYFLMKGYSIKGMDISSVAIENAEKNFGKHFISADLKEWKSDEKFQFIYHVGLIGVIDYPKEFLEICISRLKPGGVMLFNAPNKCKCNGIWVDTLPPDLRTVFEPATIFSILENKNVEVKIKIGLKEKYFTEGEKYLEVWEKMKDFFSKDNQYNMYVMVKKRG
ncbi:MAG: class I SAM-dependent methyltransferase [Lachnospiraceae bacterium]|nr:class I SAM-dependent methyltransferase [Lachnospiraceae bacterium]